MKLFNKLDPKVKRAKKIFDNWFMRLVMKGINYFVNLAIKPFRKKINSIVRRINPFGGLDLGFFDNLLRNISNLSLSIPAQIMKNFGDLLKRLEPFAAIIYCGFYTIIDEIFESATTNVEVFETMLGDQLQSLLQSEQRRFGSMYSASK